MYKQNREDFPLYMRAEDIAMAVGVSRAGAYTLMHRDDFPLVRLGKRMVVQRTDFFSWLDSKTNGKQ